MLVAMKDEKDEMTVGQTVVVKAAKTVEMLDFLGVVLRAEMRVVWMADL